MRCAGSYQQTDEWTLTAVRRSGEPDVSHPEYQPLPL